MLSSPRRFVNARRGRLRQRGSSGFFESEQDPKFRLFAFNYASEVPNVGDARMTRLYGQDNLLRPPGLLFVKI